MLNAFRHQRGSHDSLRWKRLFMKSVLNAFRHQRGSHPRRFFGAFGQGQVLKRLSASKRVAHKSRVLVLSIVDVLNAFRHQRGSHRCPAARHRHCSCVLNAFRHQRGSHLSKLPCVPVSPASAQRLSASKRVAHYGPGRFIWLLDECSTPFGIKEGRTLLGVTQSLGDLKCSTPFGIKEGRTGRKWQP